MAVRTAVPIISKIIPIIINNKANIVSTIKLSNLSTTILDDVLNNTAIMNVIINTFKETKIIKLWKY